MQFEDKLTYEKKECGVCHFNWYYPELNEEVLTPIERLFYLQVSICPYCKYCSDNIEQTEGNEAELTKSKEYLSIIKSQNDKYALVCHREAYIYLAFAYLKTKLNEYDLAGKAYLVSAELEEMQYKAYMQSGLYKPQYDDKMIKESKEKIKEYLALGLEYIIKATNNLSQLDIKDYLLLSYAYAKNLQKEQALKNLSEALKMNPSSEFIEIIQTINSMIKEI